MGLRLVATVILLGLFAQGCSAPARQAAEPAVGPSFSVLSYNVNFGGPAPQQAVAAIADADADVVCLQETNPAWEQQVRAAVGERYPHIYFHHEPAAGGTAILSKWPVGNVRFERADAGWFPACFATVKTPLAPVQVVSVHLRPPVSDRGSFASGYFTTPPIRRAEVEELYSIAREHAADRTTATVFVGDFNEGDGGSAVRFLRGQGYQDALKRFAPGAYTWRWQLGPLPLRGRLDHILHTQSLRCLSAVVLRRGSSDHFPILATFTTRATRPAETASAAPKLDPV